MFDPAYDEQELGTFSVGFLSIFTWFSTDFFVYFDAVGEEGGNPFGASAFD